MPGPFRRDFEQARPVSRAQRARSGSAGSPDLGGSAHSTLSAAVDALYPPTEALDPHAPYEHGVDLVYATSYTGCRGMYRASETPQSLAKRTEQRALMHVHPPRMELQPARGTDPVGLSGKLPKTNLDLAALCVWHVHQLLFVV